MQRGLCWAATGEKGSAEHPLEKTAQPKLHQMELRSGEPSGNVKERGKEKGKRAHRKRILGSHCGFLLVLLLPFFCCLIVSCFNEVLPSFAGKMASLTSCCLFFCRDSSREVLEWRESFDQLLKSKSESDFVFSSL